MSHLKIQLAQPVSFALGREPVSEVLANPPHITFEPDREIPGEDGQPPRIIKGKAVMRWAIVDRPPGETAQHVECRLDDATSDALKRLITDKSREHLSNAAKKSRGA